MAVRRADAMGVVVRLTQADAQQPLVEQLERVARKLTRSACTIGPTCPMCRTLRVEARESVIEIWNAAHDAVDVDRAILESDPVAAWPPCAECGKGAREGNHATDLGQGHDYVPSERKL